MHSRIFELYTDERETLYDDAIYERMKDDGYSMVDYVVERPNERQNDIEWLSHSFKVENEKLIITEEFIEEFAKEKLERINNLVSQLTTEDFKNGYSSKLWALDNAIEDEYGFNFYVDGDCIHTLESLIRYYGAKEWKIGKTFDYHF